MSTTDSLALVREFHTRFGQRVEAHPYIDDLEVNALRVRLLREETKELEDALAAGDAVAVLDALTDLQYVLDGAYLSLGYHAAKVEALAEVHRSNMSKLGVDGRPIYREDGKVLKGPSYSPPDLLPFVDALTAPSPSCDACGRAARKAVR